MAKRRHSTTGPPLNRPPPAAATANPNLLLAALPADEYAQLRPSMEVVPVRLKQLLHKAGEHIEYVYFPGEGFCSDLTVLEDGTMVEVATIGREGMVGVDAILDGGPASSTAMVQAEMETCCRVSVKAFHGQMERRGRFYELLARFAQALTGVVKQSTACNAVHTVEQRLARWLLLAQDRIGRPEFPLTQEFVAMMLGASRPTVSLVAGTLQKAGLITYRRGHVTIADREALEEASCECYRAATELLRNVTLGRPERRGNDENARSRA
jgi:CRP-like cAMP-binding protein